ncbi:DUF6531 domain-containing protein (plasmid) [Bernardetia sp. OM2101]|uniref:DUF6531 domain-containing protein n=1 Tax=Bernardetia sp. OM2101 TaxID=3344876 RepID=UPI0035CF04EB
MGFGFGCLGKFGKWVGKKAAKKFNKFLKNAIGPNKLSDKLCKHGFEPINLITGAVVYDGTDFNLPGLVPIDWKRSWYSDSAYEGWLGHGVHSVLDRCVEVYKEEQAVGLRMQDGRVVAFPMLDYGEEFYLRQEKITLKRTGRGNYEAFEHTTSLTYKFESYNGYNKYRMTAIENPSQKGIKLHVNGDRLLGITDSVGRELLVESDGAGRIVEIKLETDTVHQTLVGYKYDAKGNMTHIIDALGQATVMEHDDHLMVKKTDRNGQAFYWEYEGKNEEAKCIHTWGDGGYQEGWMDYHTEEGYNLIKDANGAVATYYYTPEGLVTQVKDPLGNSEFTEYTEFMEVYRQIDAEGNLTGFTYDGNGNMTGMVYPDGAQEQSIYDDQDRLMVTVDAEGNKRTFGYVEEKPHLLGSIVEPNNSVTVFEYDENDLLVEVRQNGQKSHLFYDEKYNLVAFEDAQKNTTTWSYDDKGQVRAVKASEQSNQIFNYDALGRVTRITGADSNTTKLTYNAYDEVIEAIDKHHHVKFDYTPLGSLQMREENGKKVFFDYDKMEQLLRIENEKNEKYTFSRNIKGDIIEEKGFDGLTRRYKRDSVGKVIKVNRPAKRWSEYEYDSVGKISRVEHYDGSFESFSYNKNGQLVEARTEKNAIFIERDSMGRVSKEIQSTGLVEDEGYEVLSTYNKNGQRTNITSSLGAAIENSYDNLGRRIHTKASLEQEESEETKNWEAKLKHNALGQEIERSLTGGITSSFAYDEAGRPISHKVKRGVHDNRNYNYTWDANHRLKETINAISQGKVEYAYDAFGNLASAKYENGSYDYKLPDEVGNLYKEKTKSEQVYGKGGKLLKDKDWYFQYDEEGNLVRKTKEVIQLEKEEATKKELPPSRFWVDESKPSKADYLASQFKPVVTPKWKHGDWFYNWQGNGMLESVKRPDGTEIRFEYDALGRRTDKINEATKEITRFVWDGNVPLHEWKYALENRPQVTSNELGELSLDKQEPISNLITWVFDEGSFVPSAKITAEDTYSIVSDYIGKPIAAYNGVGNLVWDVEYDIYGNIRSQSKGDKDFIPFRSQGQYEDVEVNLFYNRFRYYSADSGTYISQDPIRLLGNNPNIYAYVSDSNIWMDILGLNNVQTGAGRDHVTYRGTRNGKAYTGYASAPSSADLTPDEIISRRYGGNFDTFGGTAPTSVYSGSGVDGKHTARGLEQRYFEQDVANLGRSNVDNAQNPVGPNNGNRDSYLEKADNHLAGGCP